MQNQVACSAQALLDQLDQPQVLLNGQDGTRLAEQQLRQRPQTRADFQNFIGPGQFGRRNHPPELIAVMQEILTE